MPLLEEKEDGWQTRKFSSGQLTIQQYRPRIEGPFSRIERIVFQEGVYWKVTTGENITTFFGRSQQARIADPEDGQRIFAWLPEFSFDDKGNWIQYEYKAENLEGIPKNRCERNRHNGLAPFTNRYLKRVRYGNRSPYYLDDPYDPSIPDEQEAYFFELVMDYGEHDEEKPSSADDQCWAMRPDPFSSYRSGFEIRTCRLCRRILIFHHFAEEEHWHLDFGKDCLVWSLGLQYAPSSINGSDLAEVSYLKSLTQKGYVRKTDGAYVSRALPPLEFAYQQLDWNTTVKVVSREHIANAPVGLSGNYQWVDLYGEGISGILTEQAEGWYYKHNLGDGSQGARFTRAEKVIPRPSFKGITSGVLSLQDLEANGQKQVVVNSPGLRGYFELTADNSFTPFQTFEKTANVDLRDPNTRFLDLNGDGQAELVMTEDRVFTWYAADGKRGYREAEFAQKALDEEQGPALAFADTDRQEAIFLADMSGDGLTDIVRVRNGEICYWANKGYGRFSARVDMDNAPVFDQPGLFHPSYLQLADISGTGATDLLYLGKNKFRAYINLSGNGWSDAHQIEPFFPLHSSSQISVVDLLGTGTSCIVWSSALPADSQAPMRYMDLMNSRKPHLLTHYRNNLGKESSIEYKSSTHYYLEDKLAGKPWVSKLPFPVQVISKLIAEEKITNVRFSSEYQYHHGYYDHAEREFRGFGMVEQLDTEEYESWKKNNDSNALEPSEAFFQKPVLTKTWFHTGAYHNRENILNHYAHEYWPEAYRRDFPKDPIAVREPILEDARLVPAQNLKNQAIIDQFSGDEWREALSACKGMVLRQEVFALDAPKDKPSPEALKKQAKPYTVTTHNCLIQLLQPRAQNPYGVFLVTEGEALAIQYERDEADPRIAHTLNIKTDSLGNILEAASVVYPRKHIGPSLPQAVQQEQQKTLITYSKNAYTHDIFKPEVYRLRQLAESQAYELSGLKKSGGLFRIEDFKGVLPKSEPLEYHQQPSHRSLQKRLIEHTRAVFYDNSLTGPLPLYSLPTHGIPCESYQLAYTPILADHLFGSKLSDPEASFSAGRFVHSEGDDNWWIRSGRVHFIDPSAGETAKQARQRFFSPLAYTDPYGATTRAGYYKDYFLFIESVEDALHNTAKVEQFNFRTLAPSRMRDLNDNLSEVVFDELGFVKAMALLGKDLDGDGIAELETADSLQGLEETSEAEQPAIDAFFRSQDSVELEEKGRTLLGQATTRFLYDLDTYHRTGNPAVVAAITREIHHARLEEGALSPLQLSFEYSDGMGNVAMTKTQAEPGAAKAAVIGPDGSYQLREVDTAALSPRRLRWIGNGRTVLNNKGNPVKQYEPYFSVSPHYEDAPELVETGVTPLLFYDAPGRLIKTELPDGTFNKVTFDAWRQASYDPNDTVKDSRWYQERLQGLDDEEKSPDKERVAAEKAARHYDTPALVHLDTLGRPIFSIAHNRGADGADEYYATTVELDIEGNARRVIDARGNIVMEYGYDMLGHRVYQNSMDAGERQMLNDVMGNPLKAWDSRHHVFSFAYDTLQRPTEKKVEGGDGEEPLNHVYERTIYGEGQESDKRRNLRGQAFEVYDTAGKACLPGYDFKGNPLNMTRQFAADYKSVANWQGPALGDKLEPEVFSSASRYDALNRPTWSQTADGSITEPAYNEAGLLDMLSVTQSDAPKQLFVRKINYNEKGQRLSITYGNRVKTTYRYDRETFRLLRLHTQRADGSLLQDYHYTYDPVGNITEVEDRSIPTVFFGNHKLEPRSRYTYDALYRLIRAEGKEHIAQARHGQEDDWNSLPFLKKYQPGDLMAWRHYTQTYRYDAVGNILQMKHQAPGGGWTRDYAYETHNNRLKQSQVGEFTYRYPHHPAHGFITAMPHLQRMGWNFRDELQAIARQRKTEGGAPQATYYVYDGSAQRVRKVVENESGGKGSAAKKEERFYLDGLEIYRRHSGAHKGLQRTTLHVMDDSRRIAMIDRRNEVQDGTDKKNTRYQLDNHLGSASLEADEEGRVISYEEYHPYGTTAYQAVDARVKMAAKRYRFTGMERDEESGLNYHGARYFAGWLGRWVSADPEGIADGLNVFCYVGNNPIVFQDVTGGWRRLVVKVAFWATLSLQYQPIGAIPYEGRPPVVQIYPKGGKGALGSLPKEQPRSATPTKDIPGEIGPPDTEPVRTGKLPGSSPKPEPKPGFLNRAAGFLKEKGKVIIESGAAKLEKAKVALREGIPKAVSKAKSLGPALKEAIIEGGSKTGEFIKGAIGASKGAVKSVGRRAGAVLGGLARSGGKALGGVVPAIGAAMDMEQIGTGIIQITEGNTAEGVLNTGIGGGSLAYTLASVSASAGGGAAAAVTAAAGSLLFAKKEIERAYSGEKTYAAEAADYYREVQEEVTSEAPSISGALTYIGAEIAGGVTGLIAWAQGSEGKKAKLVRNRPRHEF